MSARDRDWRHWAARDWNEELFKHFFRDSDGEDHPVYRIPVTRDELVKIVSDSEADAREVQKAFLRTIRTPSHIDFNRRLSRYRIDPESGWKGSTIPPFFVDLAFSCFVASPTDEEIRNDGDFRRRLARLMGHNQTTARYPLEGLADLWRAFSKWLDGIRSVGEPYRRLELPPLDSNRVRIGYSINLAFPSRKDQIVLTQVLSKGGFEGEPPIPTVFALVGKEIRLFGPSFEKAYREFRDAFKNKEKDLERFPFWGAVREAVASVRDEEIDETGENQALKLVLEPSGIVLLLSTVPRDVISNKLAFVGADTPYGEFGSVLCVGDTVTEGSYQETVQELLRGRYRKVLSGRGWKAIDVAIEQGLLLFKKSESLSWELVFTRQEEGDFQALVKDSRAFAFLEAFPQDRRPHDEPSQYQGWTKLEHFPGELLGSLTYAEDSLLAEIRCLQPIASGPRLFLVGGCPVDGGYLGIPACLPLVRAPLSDTVRVEPLDRGEGAEPIRLTRTERDSVDFSFPKRLRNPLKDTYRVIGSLEGRVLVQKEVVFYPEVVVNDYARPTDPGSWETEAGGPDVVTYGEDPNGAPRLSDGRSRVIRTRADSAATTSCAPEPLHLLKSSLCSWSRVEASASPKGHGGREPCEFAEADRFMEICGGLAMRHKGIPEADLLGLVQDCLAVDHDQLWDVVRAWMEGGHLDRLHFKKWRRTEYFPRTPQFVLETRGELVRGVLFGLATATFRNRADVELLELGAERVQVASRSEWVVPAPAWTTHSVDSYIRASKKMGLEEPIWRRPLIETLWSLSDVVASREDPPKYYERWGCWDWNHSWFSRETKPTEEGVEVIRFQRPDRSPYYQVTIDGEHVWWSTSRNWSLLLAHELRGEVVFALAGADQVVRVNKGQVYLPLPVGRHLATTGMTVPGPAGNGDGDYVYQFRDSKERLRFLSSIWGSAEVETLEMSRWARWILALSRRPTLEPGVRVVPLPSSIRQGLERFEDVPECRELSRIKVAPSLLPRVKEGLSRFTKSRGG